MIADDARLSPTTLYGACKAAVESVITATGASTDGRGTHSVLCGIRPTGVYGMGSPPESSKWWEIVEAVANQRPAPSDGGDTEVHVDDVAHGIQILLTARATDVSGRMFNCSDLHVPRRAIAGLAEVWFDNAGAQGQEAADRCPEPPVPEPGTRNVLDSSALRALGVCSTAGRASVNLPTTSVRPSLSPVTRWNPEARSREPRRGRCPGRSSPRPRRTSRGPSGPPHDLRPDGGRRCGCR